MHQIDQRQKRQLDSRWSLHPIGGRDQGWWVIIHTDSIHALSSDLLNGYAYEPGSRDQYWVYHFFIDRLHQGKGYGKAALQVFIQLIRELYPHCRQINLAVHPENSHAQQLYTSLGFQPDGRELWGELVYSLPIQ